MARGGGGSGSPRRGVGQVQRAWWARARPKERLPREETRSERSRKTRRKRERTRVDMEAEMRSFDSL